MESLEARMGELKQGGAGGIGGFLNGTGGMASAAPWWPAGSQEQSPSAAWPSRALMPTDLMERSTEQVFGAAAESYKAEAEKMADATGFLTTEILAAQIAMSKSSGMAGTGPEVRAAPGGPGGRYRRHHGTPRICERPAGGHQRRLCRTPGLGRGAS